MKLGKMIRNIDKKRALLILLFTESLIFILGSIKICSTRKESIIYDEQTLSECWNEESKELFTPDAKLPIGIYDVTVVYDADAGIETEISYKAVSRKTVYDDRPVLSPYDHTKTYTIWINDYCKDFHVRLRDTTEDGVSLKTHSISVTTAKNSFIYQIVCLFLWLAVIYGIGFCVVNKNRLAKYSFQIVGLSVITLMASMGLFVRFTILGHDTVFHLLRIEGLREAILNWDIPVKVQTNWCFGYGYAVSAMYGDTTLIIPAIMRILGFTVQTTYKCFVLLTNLATALVAYYSFCRMYSGKNKLVPMLATFLYTCAPYRLCCIYIRAAVGEYAGTIFIPLILLWLCKLYTDDIDDNSYGKELLLPVIGFSGIIQTHVLTCVMLSIFIVMLALILYRMTFRKRTIEFILKSAGTTFLVNLWFIVPFLKFYKEPLCLHNNRYDMGFQWYGLSIAEIFAQHSSGYPNYNFASFTNLANRMSLPLGNGFVILLIFFVYSIMNRKLTRKDIIAGLAALLGIISTFFATNVFPYDLIDRKLEFLSGILTSVQFPFRYITPATAFFSAFVVLFFNTEEKNTKKKYMMILIIVTLVVSADQSMEYIYKTLYNVPIMKYYDDVNLDTNYLEGCQYLYEGTDKSRFEQENYITTENVEYGEVVRNANRFEINDINAGDNPKLELPLYYYPGYVAKTEDGQLLKVESGNNNRLSVILDNGFRGNIKVRYSEPVLWRLCEVISIASIAAIIYFEIKRRKAVSTKK